MEQVAPNLRLRGTSAERAGKWVWIMSIARKDGIPTRGALPWEDFERHPEHYVFSAQFIDEEKSARKSVTLETAQRFQRFLKREGIETEIV
jgi:hypothetical protein